MCNLTFITALHEALKFQSISTHTLDLSDFFSKVYLFLRERQSASRGGTEREGDTESEAGSRLRAVSTEPDAGLELTNCDMR